jgi:tRNA-2-methylthio-N6-dimethylallyladenosine synthase
VTGPRFHLRVFGCQMNQHDAQKIGNLLHHAGYRPCERPQDADLLLIHTCSVRDKAEQKLYSELGPWLREKDRRPDLLVGVGGCVAQQEGERLLERFDRLDFVFGPQNLVHIPAMIEAARRRERTLRVDYDDDPEARFSLPALHPEYAEAEPSPGRAYVTVMEGCDLFCAFCVVPRTRGREVSRASEAILCEIEAAAARGVVEITLLGQTVNAYGRPRPGGRSDEIPFAELLRRTARVPGIRRIRFTSPHPLFVTEELVRAFGELEALCPHIHLPVQSGSSRVLEAMNRRYDRERYLEIVAALRRVRPEIAITTDLIVGFPAETRADFEDTLRLVKEVAFTDSFSFKYSPRPGTPAVRRGLRPIHPSEAQARLEELQAVQRRLTLAAHRARIGSLAEVLVEGESRRGLGQRMGRCPWNRVVNFEAEGDPPAPGCLVPVRITGATPHSLLGTALPAAAEA